MVQVFRLASREATRLPGEQSPDRLARVRAGTTECSSAPSGHTIDRCKYTLREFCRLCPKEHGAYAILLFPILTSLAQTGLTVAGLSVAGSAMAAFLAHEPMLVVAGRRGRRTKLRHCAARHYLLGHIIVSLGCFGIAIAVGSSLTKFALFGCLLVVLTTIAVSLSGRHRSLTGQLLAVAGLSFACVPILIAGNLTLASALTQWLAWFAGFTAITFAVRGVIAPKKRRSPGPSLVILAVLTIVIIVASAARLKYVAATVPMLAVGWQFALWSPPSKYLRHVGWTLVIASAITSLLIYLTPVDRDVLGLGGLSFFP